MKKIKSYPMLFALAGMLLALAALGLSIGWRQAPPVLVMAPDAAEVRSDELMSALAEGDFAGAQTVLYGNPDLGVDRQPKDAVGQLIWDAFCGSIDYSFSGELYATDKGLARDVAITTLDITSITGTLKERSTVLLEQRVQQAEDVSQIYDEQNNYREDFVMDVLYDAATQSLQEDARYLTRQITLNLVYHQGNWWVMPDGALIQVISGSTAG